MLSYSLNVLFIIGAVQAFFLATLVFSKKNKITGDYVLGTWIGFMGIHLFNYYLFASGFLEKYPSLISIGTNFPMLQGPFMFVYVMVMISRENRIKPSWWFHALPYLLSLAYFLVDYQFLSYEEKMAYIEMAKMDPKPVILVMKLLNVTTGPFYVILSLIKLNKHSKEIARNFSYKEHIDLKWLRHVLAGLGFVWFIVVVSNVLRFFVTFSWYIWFEHGIYIAVTIAVFFLGYFGIKQQAIYVSHPEDQRDKPHENKPNVSTTKDAHIKRYEKSGLKADEAIGHLQVLKAYMEKEKPYLNGKLTLKEVADALDISENHLSQVINGQLHVNFFDFINQYRVELVKAKMNDPDYNHYTLLGVAMDCGFNSKSSFNAIFKKMTGLTPTEYLRTL